MEIYIFACVRTVIAAAAAEMAAVATAAHAMGTGVAVPGGHPAATFASVPCRRYGRHSCGCQAARAVHPAPLSVVALYRRGGG